MKQLGIALMISLFAPLCSMDLQKAVAVRALRMNETTILQRPPSMDSNASLDSDNEEKKENHEDTKARTPEAPLLLSRNKDNRLVMIDNFMNTFGFNILEPSTQFTQETMQVFEKLPIEEYNGIIETNNDVFSQYLGIPLEKNTLTPTYIQKKREHMLCSVLINNQKKLDVLEIKYKGRREQYEDYKTKTQKRMKIQCCLLTSIPLTLAWAVTATTYVFLKNSC